MPGQDADRVTERAWAAEFHLACVPGGRAGTGWALDFKIGTCRADDLVLFARPAVDDLDGDVRRRQVAERDCRPHGQPRTWALLAVGCLDVLDPDCGPRLRCPLLPYGE